MKKLVTSLLLGTSLIAGDAAMAQSLSVEHEVIIERRGFFPTTIHVNPGDTIRYVNKAPNWVTIYSKDWDDNNSGYDANDPCDDPDDYSGNKDGWKSDWIARNDEYIVEVTECMETDIDAPYVYRYSWNDDYYRGEISFSDADVGF